MVVSQAPKEIEKKYHLTIDEALFREKLEGIGAQFIKNKKETDTYFNVSGRDSIKTKECLRVRKSNDLIEITYKGATHPDSNDAHFAKHELNLFVENETEAIEFLKLLGNEIVAVVEKSRDYYEFGNCNIAVDSISGVGMFIELEVMSNDDKEGLREIENVAKKLGLSEESVEMLPYRDLVIMSKR